MIYLYYIIIGCEYYMIEKMSIDEFRRRKNEILDFLQSLDKYDKELNDSSSYYIDINIDWGRVLKGVRYDSNCSKSKIKKLKAALIPLSVSHGGPIKIEPYLIYGKPEHITIK